jgi:hypothetical protein
MPEPTTHPPIIDPPKTKAELLELLAKRDRELAAAADKLAALDKKYADIAEHIERAKSLHDERASAKARGGVGRLLGQIPVYLTDEQEDVLERAAALMAGQIPPDKAKRFRTDARMHLRATDPLAKRLGTREPPIGTEFDRDEMAHDDRMHYLAQGAIIPIA